MRIGIDASCWGNRRGFGRFTRGLLEALVSIDEANEYLFFVDSENEEVDTIPVGVKRVIADTTASPVLAASADGNRRPRDIWAMTRAVLRHDVDVFFFPAVYSYFPILNRSKVIVAIHDLIADHHPELVFQTTKSKYFWKLKQRAAVWQADVIATVSNYSKREIVEYFRVPESRVRVISEGTKPVFTERPHNNGFLAACSKFGITEGEKVLLYVGGISPHKNIGRLLDACALLRTRFKGNESFRLLLVGDYKDDPFLSAYPALKEQVGSLGLGDMVRFTGFVADEELSYLYNAATAVILPSIEEGFGLPALEAMACGAPVAASDRGSLPEVLGDAGIYFDPMDPNSIAHALTQVVGDDGLRASMSERGLERAKDFSWNSAARRTIAVFEELARGGRER